MLGVGIGGGGIHITDANMEFVSQGRTHIAVQLLLFLVSTKHDKAATIRNDLTVEGSRSPYKAKPQNEGFPAYR